MVKDFLQQTDLNMVNDLLQQNPNVVKDLLTAVKDPLTVVKDLLTAVKDPLTAVKDLLTAVKDPLMAVKDLLTANLPQCSPGPLAANQPECAEGPLKVKVQCF